MQRVFMEKNGKQKRALCLSGGGAKGAYVGGMLQHMKLEQGRDYDMYLASSTGSLIQLLASINDFDALKEGYTSMNIDDIYDISPFKKVKNPEDADQASINILSVARMHFFRGEPTFGSNEKFLDTIKKFFPYEKYLQAYGSGIDITTTVTNVSKVKTEHYSMQQLGSKERSYKDFVDWTWISTCAVPFTTLNRRVVDGDTGIILHRGEHDAIYSDYYADGGFMEHMPISKAIADGATEIDAITTVTEDFSGDQKPEFGKNPLKLLSRLFDISMREALDRDIDNARKMAKDKSVTLNIYYMPRKLTDNPMYFDKEQMSGWWDEGYEYIKKHHVHDKLCCKVIKMRAKK